MILDQMRLIQAVRAGMATEDGYRNRMGELQSQLAALDGFDTVRQAWADLKLRGRG